VRKLRRKDGLPFQTLVDRVVIVDPKGRQVHVLNETASRIWHHLAEERTVTELVALLEGEYETRPEVMEPEVESFLEELQGLGLAEAGTSEAPSDATRGGEPGSL
jgi:hypothetical protein